MGRVFNAVLLTAMIVGVILTYNMKHRAELAAERVARLQTEVTREKEAIALLKAEWSMLTQPSRLQSVVERYSDHFRLESFVPEQLASIEEIAIKPIQYDKDASEILARLAASEIEPLR